MFLHWILAAFAVSNFNVVKSEVLIADPLQPVPYAFADLHRYESDALVTPFSHNIITYNVTLPANASILLRFNGTICHNTGINFRFAIHVDGCRRQFEFAEPTFGHCIFISDETHRLFNASASIVSYEVLEKTCKHYKDLGSEKNRTVILYSEGVAVGAEITNGTLLYAELYHPAPLTLTFILIFTIFVVLLLMATGLDAALNGGACG